VNIHCIALKCTLCTVQFIFQYSLSDIVPASTGFNHHQSLAMKNITNTQLHSEYHGTVGAIKKVSFLDNHHVIEQSGNVNNLCDCAAKFYRSAIGLGTVFI